MAYESDFETLGGYFGVTLGSCVGLMGPKSANVENNLVLKRFLGAQKAGRDRMADSGPGVWTPPGRDKGRGKPLFRMKEGEMEEQYF